MKLLHGIVISFTFLCWINTYGIKSVVKQVIYTETRDDTINHVILTNSEQPKIIAATDKAITVINPFTKLKSQIMTLSKEQVLDRKIFNNKTGAFAYLALKGATQNFLLKINLENNSSEMSDIAKRELIGFQNNYLLFKDVSKNEKFYYPIIIKNIDNGDETIFNATTDSAASAKEAFLLNEDKAIIVSNAKGESIYTKDITPTKPIHVSVGSFVDNYPKNLPQNIVAQKNNSFISKSSDKKSLVKTEWVKDTKSFIMKDIFRPSLEDKKITLEDKKITLIDIVNINTKLSPILDQLEFCDYSNDESLLVAKTRNYLYYFFYDPLKDKYTQYKEKIETSTIHAKYCLGESNNFLLELKDKKKLTLYKIAIPQKTPSKLNDDPKPTKKQTQEKPNIKPIPHTSWWTRWKNYFLAGGVAGIGLLTYKYLKNNAERVVLLMTPDE